MYKLIAFDLDGTLAPSKKNLTEDVGEIFCKLIKKAKVAVISGGSLEQFQKQFLKHLACPKEDLKNLYILPTNGARLFTYNGSTWENVYDKTLTKEEKEKIMDAFNKALDATGFTREPIAQGEIIEDRESQITFSGLGQKAPLEIKKNWDPKRIKRQAIVENLKKYIPEFEIGIGGTTSIDVTKMGINKAYGISNIAEKLGIDIKDSIYIGDALYENGNDAIVKTTGIKTIQVEGPEETKKEIQKILNQ